jgi:hypothetical protein
LQREPFPQFLVEYLRSLLERRNACALGVKPPASPVGIGMRD